MGLLGKGASLTRVRLLPATSGSTLSSGVARSNRTLQSKLVVSADGQLNFDFVPGKYSDAQQAVLSGVVGTYSQLASVYGPPADEQKGKTITVTDDGSSSGYAPKIRPDDRDGGTIYFHFDPRASERVNQLNFTRLILLAFQGPNNFSTDYLQGNYVEAWQLGMADAASLLAFYQGLSDTEKATFDPSAYGFVYALPVYDLLNRPELGNAYIYPRTNLDPNSRLGDFRAAMAQAVWLKVAIEYPNFFRDFNIAYRAQVGARQAVTSNQLRAIAAQVAPQVEGLSFQDWARRQYILDNSVTVGEKIYAVVAPEPVSSQSGQSAGATVYSEAFTTDRNGNETRTVGLGTIDAFDEKGTNINAKSFELNASNLLNFSADSYPLGFSNLGTPNRARVTLKLRLKGAQTTVVFPYLGSSNAGASARSVYGVSESGDTGNVTIQGGVNETVPLTRGVFAGAQNYVGGPRVITTLTLGGRTFKRNTAWLPAGSRGVAVVLDGGAKNDKFTLQTQAGASTIRMISLPVFPTESDEAAILGFAPGDLKLAKYRPNLSTETLNGGVLTFGIGAGQHEIYPNISAPMAPGRGYWLGVGEYRRDIFGSEPPTDRPYEVPLPGGWNQFGVPFNRSFSPASIKVRFGSFAPVPYAEAVKNGLVAPGIWRWQPRGGYARVDDAPDATLPPFEGFYIFVIPARGVSLVFDSSSASSARTSSSSVEKGWSVSVAAATSSARDASNHFGISDAVAAAKPPVAAPVVTLRFASSGSATSDGSGAGRATGWADSYFVEMAREATWNFSVEGTRRGERVTLSFDGLSRVPNDIKLVLRDEKTRKSLALTQGSPYKWNSDGEPRRFSVGATRIAKAALQVTRIDSSETSIALGLSLESRGRLEIQTRGGDTVWVVKDGTFAAKTEKFTWNGTRIDGKRAPRGRYRAVWIPALSGDKGAEREFERR